MEFAYGEGKFIEDQKEISGRIILGEHRVYLQGEEGELASTFVPLEKIEKIRIIKNALEVHVRPSLAYRYVAKFIAETKSVKELAKDIVKRRGFKKVFLKQEWVEVPA